MIRDPSDGSVREKTSSGGVVECPRKCGEADDSGGSGIDRNSDDTMRESRPALTVKVPPPEDTSGLPPITEKADQLARLERDRKWLKDYLHRKPEAAHDQD